PGQHTHVRPVLGDFSVLVVGPLFGIIDKTRVVEGGLGRRVVGGGPGPYATGKLHRGDRARLVELFPVGLDGVGKGIEGRDLGVVEAAHGAGHLQKAPTEEEGVKVTGRETTPLAQGDGRQRTSSGAMASSMSGRQSSSTSMPVVAMS